MPNEFVEEGYLKLARDRIGETPILRHLKEEVRGLAETMWALGYKAGLEDDATAVLSAGDVKVFEARNDSFDGWRASFTLRGPGGASKHLTFSLEARVRCDAIREASMLLGVPEEKIGFPKT